MKRTLTVLLALLLCMLPLAACSSSGEPKPETTGDTSQPADASAGESDAAREDVGKQTILVVSFGTSYPETRALTIEAIEQAIAAAFPDYDLRRAFTSQIIINKLAERDGIEIDNVEQAMQRLVEDGVSKLIIQPTHVMHGYEYEELLAAVAPYADKIENLMIGEPMLAGTQDYDRVVEAVIAEYAPAEDTALVLMGHGTHHPANAYYAALDYRFKVSGYSNVFVGTVEGYPEVDTVLALVNAAGYQKVALAPLMIVAGDHATNDMAGDEEGSWKVIFKADGKEVDTILRGLGEIEGIHALYVEHVQAAIDSLEGSGADEAESE